MSKYLNYDCINCGRHRVENNGICEKCNFDNILNEFAQPVLECLEHGAGTCRNADLIGTLRAEIARRDEIIKRLREDAERLAIVETEMTGYEDEYEEVYCLHSGSCGSRKYQKGVEFIHTPNCPITLHRALMKELE